LNKNAREVDFCALVHVFSLGNKPHRYRFG